MQYNFLVYVNRGKLYELIGPFGKFKVKKVFIQKLTLFHNTYRIRAFLSTMYSKKHCARNNK